jgi:hypothetical protein
MGFWKIVVILVLLYFGYRFVSGLSIAVTASLVQTFWWMFP